MSKSTLEEIARTRVIDRLAAEEMKKMNREAEKEEWAAERQAARERNEAARIAAVRKDWDFDSMSITSLSKVWAHLGGGSLLELPTGANGAGSPLHGKPPKSGHIAYATTPHGCAVLVAEPEIMRGIVKTHKLPDTLTWLYRGEEYRLYAAPRFKRSLQTEKVQLIAGRSQERLGFKLVMTGATWITPPSKALPEGSDRLPELPASFVDGLAAYGQDIPGTAAAESFILGMK